MSAKVAIMSAVLMVCMVGRNGSDREHRSTSEYGHGEKDHREAAHHVTSSRLTPARRNSESASGRGTASPSPSYLIASAAR
jgi:hypothetical protein